MFKRLLTAILLTVLSVTLLLSVAFAYLIVTPLGGKLLVRYFKQEFASVGLMHVGHFEGTLQNGFILKDILIKDLSYFPDALVRIQEIRVHLTLWDLTHTDFNIFNARIFIPDSDPLVFTGDIIAGKIKGNLYARSVDVHAASRFWANDDIRKNLQGFASNVDLAVSGLVSSPVIEGSFVADSIRYKSIVVTDAISKANLVFLAKDHLVQMKGGVVLYSGNVLVRKVNLQLSPSNFTFQGDVFNPVLNIRLGAKVEDMDIHLAINGTAANPQLSVTSDPIMPPQQALQVLFTGNAVASSVSPFNGVTSTELAQNFLDYSLQDMNEQQQLGLKTKLTDNLKLGVEMDQMPTAPGDTSVFYSRKINGEMDLSEHTSLNVSQEVLPQNRNPSQAASDAQPSAETQVYVQYKKRF